jgi:hypothetical protein
MANYDIFRKRLETTFPENRHALWGPSSTQSQNAPGIRDVGYIWERKLCRIFNVLFPQKTHPTSSASITNSSSSHFLIIFLGALLNTVISIQPESGWFQIQIILPQGNHNPRPEILTTDVVLA